MVMNCIVFSQIFQQTAADTFKKFNKSSKVKAPRTCTLTYDYKLQKMKLSLWDSWSRQESHQSNNFFLDKLQTQQLLTLSNLQVQPSNMVFLNKGTAIQDAPRYFI